MNFIIKKNILLENLNNVSKAISSKNLIPILTGIKFELKKNGLYLYASDSDISIKSFIENKDITEVKEIGSIVIGGRYIVEIIKKLPDTDIHIEVIDGYKMIISTDNSEFNLNGINPEEFPNLDFSETKEPINLSTGLFKTIINQTSFATSMSETRPLLTGINFKNVNDCFEIIATDSYRLAMKDIDVTSDKDFNIVIPCKNLIELSRIIDDDKSNLEVHIFTNKVLFKYKNILFLSRLLNGQYPATSEIIPIDFDIIFDIKYSDFYQMIDRASLLTSDREKNTIKLELKDRKLIISSNSPEIGKVEEVLDVDTDKEVSISFSSRFMLDAIRSFGTEEISLFINNDSSPIVIKSKKENSLTQLVLPIKTY